MKRIYVYMADCPETTSGELELSETPTRIREGLALYAVAESPEIGALYAKLTERLGWHSRELDGGFHAPALIYNDLILAARSLPDAGYALRRIVPGKPGFVETLAHSMEKGGLVTSDAR